MRAVLPDIDTTKAEELFIRTKARRRKLQIAKELAENAYSLEEYITEQVGLEVELGRPSIGFNHFTLLMARQVLSNAKALCNILEGRSYKEVHGDE